MNRYEIKFERNGAEHKSAADGETFERVAEAAADKLGVSIY